MNDTEAAMCTIRKFATILDRVEQVHLQNRLLGELKGDVAKIWCCSRWRTGKH